MQLELIGGKGKCYWKFKKRLGTVPNEGELLGWSPNLFPQHPKETHYISPQLTPYDKMAHKECIPKKKQIQTMLAKIG